VLERNLSQCHFVRYISYMDYTSRILDLGGETLVIDLRHRLVVFYIKPSNFSKSCYFRRQESSGVSFQTLKQSCSPNSDKTIELHVLNLTLYAPCIILQYVCTLHHPTICMHRASSYNIYAPCIILQYLCTVHHPTICMHRASSYNMYMNHQDAKILVISLYFPLDALHV
jgi:hypothetical protein